MPWKRSLDARDVKVQLERAAPCSRRCLDAFSVQNVIAKRETLNGSDKSNFYRNLASLLIEYVLIYSSYSCLLS